MTRTRCQHPTEKPEGGWLPPSPTVQIKFHSCAWKRCEVTLTLGCHCSLNSNCPFSSPTNPRSPDTSSDFKMRRESRHWAVITCLDSRDLLLTASMKFAPHPPSPHCHLHPTVRRSYRLCQVGIDAAEQTINCNNMDNISVPMFKTDQSKRREWCSLAYWSIDLLAKGSLDI